MKKIIVYALTLMVSFTAWAGDRTDAEMRSIALSQMVQPSVKGQFPTSFHVDRLKQYDQMSVYGNEDGFVFVSHDDRIKPVLGYTEGTFDTANLPDGLRWWIQKMNTCLADWRNTPDDVVAARQESVLRLVSGYTAVPNFLKSKWDQGEPYNYYTPTVNSVKAATGCVATAMAQIIYYFQYPAQGKGEGYYYKGSSGPYRVDINGVYDYSKMKNVYAGSVSQEQKEAIGALMRDCGYAAKMQYNLDGYGSSGAHIQDAAAGLDANFSYDQLAMRYYTRDYYKTEEWLKLVYDELTQKRPILYGGLDPSPGGGGHAFVLCGFNDEGYVFVNWGWSGGGNDYYDIALLNSPNGTFSAEQDMTYRLKPHVEADPEDYFESNWGFYEYEVDAYGYAHPLPAGWEAKLTSTTLKLDYDSYYNCHFLTFNGSVGAVFENATTGAITTTYEFASGTIEPNSGKAGNVRTLKFNQSPLSGLPTGTYRVYLASKDTRDAKYVPMRSSNQVGAVYYELTKSGASSYTISEAKNFAGGGSTPVTTFKLVYMLNDEVYKTYYKEEGETITPEPAPAVEADYEFSGWSEIPATMPAHEVVVTGYIHQAKAHVKLSPAGYATFYNSKEAFALPSGVTAYAIPYIINGKLKPESVGTAIPAGTAVMLKGAADAEITLTRKTGVAAYSSGNLLYGSDESAMTSAAGDNLYYKLTYGKAGTYQEAVFGWYWGAANGAAFRMDGGKAWLAIPASLAGKLRFLSVDGETTGIEALDMDADSNGEWYDLQGRRVTTPVRGLFIHNGRKVFVK